jgi:glycosyltransferase involved in cell wall biosynthesis
LHIAVVGVSDSEICGVRDHAALLTDALRREGVRCSTHWLDRREQSLRGGWREFSSFTRAMARDLRAERPDVVLLHYSVFAFSIRGIPVFAGVICSALHRTAVPVICAFHEVAYSFRLGGLRGKVWALTQRAALVVVMRSCDAVLETADFRAQWLRSRPWLPKRPLAIAPVFSNLPVPTRRSSPAAEPPTIGLFGYAYQGAAVQIVLDAIRSLRERIPALRLNLLGAPGPSSPVAALWLSEARRLGVQDAISFSGTLAPQALSDALAGCDVLLFADTAGPSSRKTSLAASLAAGPVVAIDGRLTWPALVDAGAVRLAAPTPDALAEALAGVLGDAREREALAARGERFARTEMGADVRARAVVGLYEELRAAHVPRA